MLTATLRPKTCRHCGHDFEPVRLMQQVCSPICAARKVKADKVRERVKQSVPWLMKEPAQDDQPRSPSAAQP